MSLEGGQNRDITWNDTKGESGGVIRGGEGEVGREKPEREIGGG